MLIERSSGKMPSRTLGSRAGYRAASQAERAGMYHTALMLYQKLRPHVSIDELGPRLAGVLLVLGDWEEANRLIGLLPVEDSSVRLLRSKLAFVRGDSTALWPKPRWRSSAAPPSRSTCSST